MTFQIAVDDQKGIFQSLPVSACVVDRQPRYVTANDSYAELFGTTTDKLVGRSVIDFMPPEVIAKIHADFLAFDAGATATTDEIVVQDRHFLVSIHPIRRDDGNPVAAFATLTDISTLKKSMRELATGSDKLLVLNARMTALAETDALTGLANRRGLDRFLNKEMRRCRREKKPISIAIIDIDHFKLFNDRHGHMIGDAALRDIGAAVQGAIRRPGDCVARYGGEEFVVILPGTDLRGAEHVCDNIQQAIANLAIAHQTSPFKSLTVSIGIAGAATIPRDRDWTGIRDDLLRSADEALYRVKDAGRNGVQVWRDKDMPAA